MKYIYIYISTKKKQEKGFSQKERETQISCTSRALVTLDTAVCAASPSAVAGNPSISPLSVINFSKFLVASNTFSLNFCDIFSSSYRTRQINK